MKQFPGLIGIGGITDPVIRESLRTLDVWARQVEWPEGAPTPSVSGGRKVPLGADAWPVGSIFISIDPRNPGPLLQFGVWVPFATGRFLVGVDTTDTDFDTVEETGGAKTHQLTEDEIP